MYITPIYCTFRDFYACASNHNIAFINVTFYVSFTPSGVVVCPSLAVSTEQIHARTTTELCSLQACIADTPADWRRRPGRPRQSWLRTVETDLRPLNLGLTTAKRRTQDRAARRRLVVTATSTLTSSWMTMLTSRDSRLRVMLRSNCASKLLFLCCVNWQTLICTIISRPYWVVRSRLWYDVLSVRRLSVVCL